MLTYSAISHTPKSADAYAFDDKTLHVRIKTAKSEVSKITLWIGDPYIWEEGGLDGGNLGGSDAHGWKGGTEVVMHKEGETQHHEHWIGYFEPPKLRSRYGFIIESNDGEKVLFGEKRIVDITDPKVAEVEFSNLPNFFCFPYINPCDVLTTPKWVENTIWYQIFPERFCNGRPDISPENVQPWGTRPSQDNFMGGDLWGVVDKLDYLQELGVNGLYFCPIFTASANHKYDTVDYFNVDPHFGGNEAFRTLVDEAHKRGMKVMLDAVFNHVGDNCPIWVDVLETGEDSKFADWFWINEFPVNSEKPNYETFGNVGSMPKLNTENSECREFLLDIARHWVKEFNIDGWRLDVANEVDHKFWRDFRDVVKGINPDCYILGEIWHEGMAWLRGDQYDSLMNYPLTQSILDFFAYGFSNKQEFMFDVTQSYTTYPHNVNKAMFNLLDSHDTSRILSLCDENIEKAKLAYLFMFTQVGSPCIYYGGEIGLPGMRGNGAEDNRACMEWDETKQNLELRTFIQALVKLRKKHKSLNDPVLNWLDVQDEHCVAYQRGELTFIINNSDQEKLVDLNGIPYRLAAFGHKILGQ